MTEDELRDLMGVGSPLAVQFAGQQWALHRDRFAALLSYALSSARAEPEGGEELALAALHRLLERCVIDFEGFSKAAVAAKAGMEEVQNAAKRTIEVYCARSFWPAMRLLGFVAVNLEEIDGDLLRKGGRGIAGFTPREACNLALAICLEGREEEDRQFFLEDLNYEGSAESEALAQLRAYQKSRKEAAEAAGGGSG